MLSSNYFSITKVNDNYCMAHIWLLTCGFTIMSSSLFIKTFRIWYIFQRKQLTLVKMTGKTLCFWLFICLLFDIILNIIWSTTGNMNARYIKVDEYRPGLDYKLCGGSDATIFFAITISVKSLIILSGAIISYLVRNTPTEFHESTSILISLYNILLTCSFLIPIIALDVAGIKWTPIITSLAVIFITLGTALILFIPKLYIIYAEISEEMHNNYSIDTDNSDGSVATGLKFSVNTNINRNNNNNMNNNSLHSAKIQGSTTKNSSPVIAEEKLVISPDTDNTNSMQINAPNTVINLPNTPDNNNNNIN